MAYYPLTIGPVTLVDGFEAPDGAKGGLSDLGTKQKAVVREYPGGIVTAQLFGAFPKMITWSGMLFGENKIQRSRQLQKLAKDGDFINFNFADWNLDGFVEDYQAAHKGRYIEYTLSFKPLYDNVMTEGSGGSSKDPFGSMVADSLNAMNYQANNPASDVSLPSKVLQGTVEINQNLNDALIQSGGSAANLPAGSVQSLQEQISNLQSQLDTLINGPDPALASSAADLSGSLSVLSTALNNSQDRVLKTLTVKDPNIFQLAEEFYGDAKYFGYILEKNDLFDALPQTAEPITIKIPYIPDLPVNEVPVVLNG